MEKEKFMEFVSRAFDSDAKIDITFFSDANTEESAKALAEEFAQIVERKVEELSSSDYSSRWFKVDGRHQVSIFHQNSRDKKLLKEQLQQLLKEEEELA